TRWPRDWSSDVCSSDLQAYVPTSSSGWRQEVVHGEHDLGEGEGRERFAPPHDRNLLVLSSPWRAVDPEAVARQIREPDFRDAGRSEERRVGKECECRWA